MDLLEIERRFSYHAPTGTQSVRYEKIRDIARGLAELFLDLCPDSRERSVAIRKLEEAVMWANAAIARRENTIAGHRLLKPGVLEDIQSGKLTLEDLKEEHFV